MPVAQTIPLFCSCSGSQCGTDLSSVHLELMRTDVFPGVFDLKGGTVHLVCRNKGRADEARTHIVEQSKNEVKRELFIEKIIARCPS